MGKIFFEWKADGFKTTSKGRFVAVSIFFILTATAGIFGLFIALFFIILLRIPKKCIIDENGVRYWFKKLEWSQIKKYEWNETRLKVYNQKNRAFVLPVPEEL